MKRALLYTSSALPYLIALFFCLHGLADYATHISSGSWLALVALYFIFIFIADLLLQFIYKPRWKSSLFNASGWFVFFFFSALHQFLKNATNQHVVSSYSILLPSVIIVLIVIGLTIYLKETKPAHLILFLNLLLTVWIVADGIRWSHQLISERGNQNKPIGHDAGEKYIFNKKPSVYLLLFDEYTGSACMYETLQFRNGLDSFLEHRAFHVFKKSRSNYNFTTFSILSMLQMDYLNGFDRNSVTHKDYLNAEKIMLNNKVLDIFSKNKYSIANYSIFDFQGYQGYEHHYLLPNQTMLLRKRTFFQYILNDLGWHFIRWNLPLLNVWERSIYRMRDYNTQIREALFTWIEENNTDKPHFVYAHFMMPHPPFFYDSTGKERAKKQVLHEMRNGMYPVSAYVSNLIYTNTVIQNLVIKIQSADPNAIIMIAGDHGFRTKDPHSCRNFSNFNAIYFPPVLRPQAYPDEITLVNQFRFIFNQLSPYKEMFLPDDTIFLKDDTVE